MYSIEKRNYGFLLTFGGFIQLDEMTKWLEESKRRLALVSAPFGVIVDMRELKPLPSDTQATMIRGQQLYQAAGMQRSAVILLNSITTVQFRRLAAESGIDSQERYIDASFDPAWETKAIAWVMNGVDPTAV